MFRTEISGECLNFPENLPHEFTEAVYYNGMPSALHMHSQQFAYLKQESVRAIWFSPALDPYLFGVRVMVHDKWPRVCTLDIIVKRSRAIDLKEIEEA
jgi:hypothetical protein